MFYEYAIDPKVLADISRCRVFFQSFDKSSRLISDVPKNWQREVYQTISQIPFEDCGPVYKKTLKNALSKLLRKNLVKSRASESNSSGLLWEGFIEQEHKVYPFSAIIGLKTQNAPVRIYNFDELVFQSPECWGFGDQMHVERKASSIVDAMAPLLSVSKSIRLVDPYFKFTRPTSDRYLPVLRELVSRLNSFNYGNGIKTISIDVSDEMGSGLQQLASAISSWLPDGVTIKISEWPHNDMHDRFLLTDVGGLMFGHGLDESTPGAAKQVLVSVLTNKSYRAELQKVSEGSVDRYQFPEIK